ncbi:MAG: hypothetical protein MUC28_01580, partial [Planctomycetes bacterium]|nr:hypothetical protein [Planctomycetota bacterium]
MINSRLKLNNSALLAVQLFLYALLLAFFLPQWAEAQTAAEEEEICEDSRVSIVARDPGGDFIPNINIEIYQQTTDADGNPKPGKKVAGGKTDPILGRYEYIFKRTVARGTHALKLWDKNKDIGSFWLYDELIVGCGDAITIDERLSGLRFVLRDTAGNLLKNKEFSVYTQRYDADGDPIKEKQDLVAKLNTSAEGEAKAYVSGSQENLERKNGDYYVFETAGRSGGTYTLYDIEANAGALKEIEYVLSDLEILLTDNNDVPFPANTKIAIFKQAYDADDDPILGDLVKEIATDDRGSAVLEYPAGLYAARLTGANGQYEYFYELEINDGQRESYQLIPGELWEPNEGACAAASQIMVVLRDLPGNYIPKLPFELYAASRDSNDQPVVKKKLLAAVTDERGRAQVTTHPNPLTRYALKVYSLNPTVGEYWFFDDWQFVCGENKVIEKNLPALRVVIRDGNGNLLKNQKFSLHTQKFDIDGRPVLEKKDLVSAN